MAKIVELPDGREAEFPDDMSNDAIGAVLSKQFGPPSPPKTPDSFASRVATGFADPIHGAAQIADRYLVNPIRQRISPGATSMEDVTRQRDAEYNAPEGFDAARMAGNLANPVTWAGGGASPLRAAYAGAVQGGLTPVAADQDFAAEKAKQAGIGAAGGALLTKALAGLRATPEAQELMRQGIQPTVGQSLGGMANRAEQKLTSVPFVGDAINYARNRAQNEFEARYLKRALGQAPQQAQTIPQQIKQVFSQETIPGTSSQVQRATAGVPTTLDQANAVASQQFDAVVPHLRQDLGTWVEPQLAAQAAMHNPEMTAQNRRILTGLVNEHFDPVKISRLTPDELKTLDSQMGFLIRKYAKGDPASQTLADELRNVQTAFRGSLDRLLPDNMRGDLNDANRSYARLIPANKAASARADERMMPRAVQRAQASQRGMDVSRMPADPLVDSAVSVLPNTVPDSGTVGRAMLGGGALVGGGTLGVLPQMLGGGAVAGLGALRPMQRAAVGNTAWQRGMLPVDAEITSAILAALRGQGNERK